MTKPLLVGGALLFSACSSGTTQDDRSRGAANADEALIDPEGLTVTALAGGNGVLDVIALTLREGLRGIELTVALRNTGEIPACSAAVSVELFDEAGQSLAAGIGGLLTQRFYRLTDGSGTIAACVGPGDVTMAALTDWPTGVALEDIRAVLYRCPYFALDVTLIEGITIGDLTGVQRSAGTAYTGTLVNGLEVGVGNPSVTVFPVNRVGRPLGSATATGALEVSPGASWTFETNAVDAPGVDAFAYPAGALAK